MVIDTNIHDISVIIPTFDRCELLKRTLEFVIKQTKKPREIIVVDNGSKDHTYEMVSSLFSNVIYLKEKKKVSAPQEIEVYLVLNLIGLLY